MSLRDNIRIKIREKMNPYFGPVRRFLGGVNPDFTIISNNCWAGHVYRYYNVPYKTPTIGLFFFADDYVKFCKNLKYYINLELRFLPIEESKHYDFIREKGLGIIPIGILDDVEIVFLHYKSEEEAYKKWERRKSRICWDNLFFKFSEQNQCTYKELEQFDMIDTKNKFVFVSKDYGLKSQVVFRDYLDLGEVPNDTTNFRKYINLSHFLMGKPFMR